MAAAQRERRTVAELRAELDEQRRLVTHYSRMTTKLEMQLEQVDREQQRAYARVEQLATALEIEESRRLGGITPKLRRRVAGLAGAP